MFLWEKKEQDLRHTDPEKKHRTLGHVKVEAEIRVMLPSWRLSFLLFMMEMVLTSLLTSQGSCESLDVKVV